MSRLAPPATPSTLNAVAGALLLDTALLLLFAALGRRSHDESGTVVPVLTTAAPFLLGWLSAAALLRLDRAPRSARAALHVWLLGIPLGLALRALLFGRGVAPSFVAVALAFTAVTLLGWRLAAGLRRA